MFQRSLLFLLFSTFLLSKPILPANVIETAIDPWPLISFNIPGDHLGTPAGNLNLTRSGEISHSAEDPEPSLFQRMAIKFLLDPIANSLAVIVLIGMIISLIWLSWAFVSDFQGRLPTWEPWVILLLTLIGLGVAVYLSYVEVTASNAICGPVGNCNSVQQSSYARLFGLIPVGLLGIVGYTAILIAWGLGQLSLGLFRKYTPIAIWVMAWLGTIFSIYLTFLEPFVIGATCMWCLSSAVIMTIILWSSTHSAKMAFNSEE